MQIHSSLFVLIIGLIKEDLGLQAHPSVSALLSTVSILPLTSPMLFVTGLSKALVPAVAKSITRLFVAPFRSFEPSKLQHRFLLTDSANSYPYLIEPSLRIVTKNPRNAHEVSHTCAPRDKKECRSEAKHDYTSGNIASTVPTGFYTLRLHIEACMSLSRSATAQTSHTSHRSYTNAS